MSPLIRTLIVLFAIGFILVTGAGLWVLMKSRPGATNSIPVAAPAPQMTFDRVRVSAAVEEELLMHKTSPVYPPEAKAKGVQGTVTLSIVIDKQGRVMDVKTISGNPMLAPAAIDAVKQWRYQEYVLNGKPVEVMTTVQVNFRLQQS